jgi:hypothetical protein
MASLMDEERPVETDRLRYPKVSRALPLLRGKVFGLGGPIITVVLSNPVDHRKARDPRLRSELCTSAYRAGHEPDESRDSRPAL